MSGEGRRLDAGRIRGALGPDRVIGGELVVYDEVSSTNDEIHRRAQEGAPEGLVVFAEAQTRGRGRRGDRWQSTRGMDLLFSVLLRPSFPRGQWSWLTQGSAVAVCRALEGAHGLAARIKWPNDIYLGEENRKVCGILLETRLPRDRHGGGGEGEGYAVLGIGLNVNSGLEDFPPELRETAISVRRALAMGDGSCGVAVGGEIDRETLVARVLGELDALYARGGEGARAAICEAAIERSVFKGRSVALRSDGGEYSGRFLGVGEAGELVLELPGGGRKSFVNAEKIRIVG